MILDKEQLFGEGILPEETFQFSSGGQVRFRSLKPSERARIRGETEDRKIVLALHFALIEPSLTEEEALLFLDSNPFAALELYEELCRSCRSMDEKRIMEKYQRENRQFMSVIGTISRIMEKKNE